MGTKSVEVNYPVKQKTDRIVFLAETDFKAWTKIVGLEDRFRHCDVMESTAKSMTTEALVESVIHYPLNNIILFYNCPETAVETIVQNSTLHKELLSRVDASEWVMSKYVNARPVKTRDLLISENSIMIEDDIFLSFFIDKYELTPKNGQEYTDSLVRKLEQKVEYTIDNLASFSEILLEPTTQILGRLGLSSNQLIRSGGTFIGYSQIRTPLFQLLDGILRSEWSDDVIAYKDSAALANYPGTVLHAHSSARYNCHSYAWYQDSTSNQVWLNRDSPLTNTFQLKKYWTADLYENTSAINGQRIYYPNGDHSAIKLPNGHFLSKWGDGPLMEHTYNNCPYLSTNLQYYKEKTLPLNNTPEISGPDYVAPNVSNIYTTGISVNSYIHYSLTAEGLDPSWTCSVTQVGTDTYSVVFNDYGAYYITVKGYASYNGVSHYYCNNTLLVICVGYLTMQRIINEGVEDLQRFLIENQGRLSE